MNNSRLLSPTRKVEVKLTDNGAPFACSMTSHKNININAEVQVPLQLPGLIIFVHGVNSEGEWYDYAEKALCDGLNERLGLKDKFSLVENKYDAGRLTEVSHNESGWSACGAGRPHATKKPEPGFIKKGINHCEYSDENVVSVIRSVNRAAVNQLRDRGGRFWSRGRLTA